MKKVLFFFMAALALTVASCGPEKKGGEEIDWSKVTVDGFYVAGPATGSDEIKPECVMAAGFNEVDKAVREGMYEKYIVLEADKDFYLLYNDGGKKTKYGATLEEFVTPLEEVYNDNPEKVLKGKMIEGTDAPSMKVAKTGLYHIVLDINKAGDLKEPQILLLDASDFGVRGGMNGWGFTSSDPKVTEFTNDGITFTFKDQELAKNGEFKFSTGNYWKVTLDDAGKVKAEVSLAENMTLNGANIKVEKGGLYDITLTFKLAQGTFDKSFSYTAVCTKESTAPEQMYMIGEQWGGWSWDSEDVAEFVPVWGAVGYFWITRFFEGGKEFKFCAVKAWNGDFGDNGNNVKIENEGFYTILVNGNDNTFEIMPAEVYGIGSAWGANAWDFNADDPVKFVPEGKTLVATVTNTDGAVRLASKVTPSAAIENVTTPNGWIDWWKTEFVYFDGKIAYRGAGNDQERVAVEAGQKITIDFNAGTVEVGAAWSWDDIAETAGPDSNTRIKGWKFYANASTLYFLFRIDKTKIKGSSETLDWDPYIYIGIDTDNNAGTGAGGGGGTMDGCEAQVCIFPWRGTKEAPECVNGEDANGWIKCPVSGSSLGTPTVYGKIEGDWCYEEVRIPRDLIGATAAGTIAFDASMSWYALGRNEITLN